MEGVKAKVINHRYNGYSTTDLILNDKIEAVIKDKPDIQWIMATFSKQLPDSLIIIQTANPTIYLRRIE
ncbi:hypothetical protein CAT7_00870 [Carnobacterium sp. AT7]|uniref:hypothetical protein n=1 Tax=Carnobacterium sp. AT7 TaxID=333990 RepID=UPI00015F182A|nr:hypothetical protein [Carnobacterium sp. AT7]EDP68067.1 hypothetical protein CAT7_00870 [Carnobacterium sp. AT7]